MGLPKPITSQYDLILPSTGKEIKYRPFLVKEEKILLEAVESKNQNHIINAMKQILKSCILTRGIKVEELPSFDIEYIFLNVRAKSAGENLELVVTCGDDGETRVPVTIFIDEIQVQKNPEHSRDIELGGDLVVRMKYPSLKQFVENNFYFGNEPANEEELNTKDNIDKAIEIICSNIDVIFNKEEVFAASDCSQKELADFVNSLTNLQFKKIETFFETMPVLKHEFVVTNPKTGKENPVVLDGITSFFI